MKDFHRKIESNIQAWREYYDSTNPQDLPLPAPYDELSEMLHLIILKSMRPDKLVPAVRVSTSIAFAPGTCISHGHIFQAFITRNLDKSFVEPPPFDLGASFADSSPKIPLVFLLSAGSDPMASLFMFAKQRSMYEK